MRAEMDEEDDVPIPPEQDAEVVIDGEGPIVLQIATQLARPEKGVARIGREPAKRRSEHRRLGLAQLLRPT